jgi:hypothetical protein
VSEAVEEWKAALQEWNRLPENEMDATEVVELQKKLKDAGAELTQRRTQ